MVSPSDGRTRPALALGVVALCAAALLQSGAAPTDTPARPWPPPRPSASDLSQDASQTRPWPPPNPAEHAAYLSGLL
ncbi:hypothetical protein ACFQZ4_11465 [Catellatospora coxensis]|uniref:Uncharacterized protein n=1 Tax=Catellatospora coxensis TaxID=310354 RepID=A0A8J3P864_9ACTN|nr:hypothetical protein [Catellatospora coxensis]GIG07083.1 hypothetical protein Cco03nite_37830 [Catellatospora coxensis]